MSVYINTDCNEFKNAIESILIQSYQPDYIYIGVDGEVSNSMKNVLLEYLDNYEKINLFYFKNNIGLGKVLSFLTKKVKTKYIARMDTDDICLKNRFEIMINHMEANNIDLLGSYIIEYTPGIYTRYLKQVPLTPQKIISYSKYRNPFNHVTILIRKTVIDNLNYEDCKFAEDWYLWLRVIKSNRYKYENIPIPTVLVNVANYSRLSGFNRFLIEKNYFYKFYKENLISLNHLIINLVNSFIFKFLLSNKIQFVYKIFLRKKFYSNLFIF